MMINREQYTAAVKHLLKAEAIGSRASRIAAQLLLSCYNGAFWHFSIPDLAILDPSNLRAAMVLMAGRAAGIAEPHEVIDGGDRIFSEMWNRWRRFHLHNRWKSRCGKCNGDGYWYRTDEDYEFDQRTPCAHCNCTGWVAEVQGMRAQVIERMDAR